MYDMSKLKCENCLWKECCLVSYGDEYTFEEDIENSTVCLDFSSGNELDDYLAYIVELEKREYKKDWEEYMSEWDDNPDM